MHAESEELVSADDAIAAGALVLAVLGLVEAEGNQAATKAAAEEAQPPCDHPSGRPNLIGRARRDCLTAMRACQGHRIVGEHPVGDHDRLWGGRLSVGVAVGLRLPGLGVRGLHLVSRLLSVGGLHMDDRCAASGRRGRLVCHRRFLLGGVRSVVRGRGLFVGLGHRAL